MNDEEFYEDYEDDRNIISLIERNKYKLHEKLGEGSYGEVFLAEENQTREPVAIKVMQLRTPSQLRNYIKEKYFGTYFPNCTNVLQSLETYSINDFRNLSELPYSIYQSNDVIMNLFDSEDDEDEEEISRYGVLVLEQMDFDLMDYILSKGKLSEEESKLIFREICKGMKNIHDRHVAHLDLKPDNILVKLTRSHQIRSIKICDFGFAVEWDKLQSDKLPPNFKVSFGTKEYQSPESFNPKFSQYDILDKVDIWSLGVTLFVMITGLFPYIIRNGVLYTVGVEEVGKYCKIQKNCKYEDTVLFLVEQMLHQNPLQRPSISDILSHPWLSDRTVGSKLLQKRKGSLLPRFSSTDKCFVMENTNVDSDFELPSLDSDSSFSCSNNTPPLPRSDKEKVIDHNGSTEKKEEKKNGHHHNGDIKEKFLKMCSKLIKKNKPFPEGGHQHEKTRNIKTKYSKY